MKSTGELTDFFYDELYGDLQALEDQRKSILNKLIKINVGLGAVFIPILIWIFNAHSGFSDALFIPLVIWGVIDGIAYKLLTGDYTHDFKIKIIRPLVKAIDPGLSFSPHTHVSQYLFKRSKLFTGRIDRFNGNDLVKGAIDGINIQFSDLHAERKTRSGKNKEHWETLFQGLFISCEFNKHFKGRTVVLPDSAENLLGSVIGGWLQANNFSRDELVRMDNPEFEKAFVVYGSDQIEARYLLTHSMMARLLELKKRSGSYPLYASFIGGHIYIAIAYGKDLFEPSLFTSLLKYRQAAEYVSTMRNAIGIVRELKLNERLWSKKDNERSDVDHFLQTNDATLPHQHL